MWSFMQFVCISGVKFVAVFGINFTFSRVVNLLCSWYLGHEKVKKQNTSPGTSRDIAVHPPLTVATMKS